MSQNQYELHADDWLFTAGLVGLSRLFKDEIDFTPTGVIFKREFLSEIPQRYFHFLLDNYSIVRQDRYWINIFLKQFNKDPKKSIQQIKGSVNKRLKVVGRYFEDTPEYAKLNKLHEDLKEIKKVEQLDELKDAVDQYFNVISTKFIDEKLTLNYFKATLLKQLFGQPSFLNVSKNALSLEEQIQLMYHDYIRPVELEMDFINILAEAKNIEEIHQLFQTDHFRKETPYNKWKKLIKPAQTVEEAKKLLRENVPRCAMVEGFFATQSFEEKIFSPLGISKNNAFNFSWNFNKEELVPISALARLILFMVPIGVSFYTRYLGNQYGKESHLYCGFVLGSSHFKDNFEMNENYFRRRQGRESFESIIRGLVQDTEERAKRKDRSFLFVELFSEDKRTLLDYYHMPPYAVRYFKEYGSALEKLLIVRLRDEYVRAILRGHNPREPLFEYVREAVTESNRGLEAFIAAREYERLVSIKKGKYEVKKMDRRLSVIYNQGKKIRDHYITVRGNESNEQNGKENISTYQASAQKKIAGISYRLLNTAKAGDRKAFLDIVFRLYIGVMSSDESIKIPNIFMDALKDEGLDFDSLSAAFIAGLLSDDYKNKNGGDQK